MSGVVTTSLSGNIRSDDYLDTYANTFRMGTTLADFTLIFGSTDDLGINNMRNMDRASIHVSPQMLKLLSLQISANLDAYERVFGVIQNPKKVTDALEQSSKALESYFLDWNK